MMRIAGDVAIAIGGSWLLALIVKATIVCIGSLAAARLARRARASVRHVLLATGFVVLLTLPLFSLVVPARDVVVPVAAPTTNVALAEGLTPMPRMSTQPMTGRVAVPETPPAIETRPSAAAVLMAMWIAGAVFFLAAMVQGIIRVSRVSRNGIPWSDGQGLVEGIAAAAAVRRRIDLVVDDTLPGPVTCGVLRPTIVLPRGAQTWRREDLERAIVHEVEHIRRWDWLMLCVARAVCAIYWFHPLVWVAWRRLRLEAERACDDAVLRGGRAEDYADQLVTLAARLASHAPQSALAMANRGDLSARVRAVLDDSQQRGRAGVHVVAAACAAAVLLLVTVGPLRTIAVAGSPQAAASSRIVIQPLQRPYFPPDSTPQPVSLEWLDGDEWAFQMQSIIRNEELVAYSRLKTAPERDAFITRFWAERDPSPGTPENEFQAEYTRRLQFTIERFGASGQPGFGFASDRGRIYLILGSPDAIENEGAGPTRAETWRYRAVPGVESALAIRFSVGRGDYCHHRIVSPPIRTIEATAADGPVNEPVDRLRHATVQIHAHGMTVISVPMSVPGVVGAAYDLHSGQGVQVDHSQIGWMDGRGKSELLAQHLPPGWLDAGLGCTWALPADTYTLSTALRFVNGQVQRGTATFDVP